MLVYLAFYLPHLTSCRDISTESTGLLIKPMQYFHPKLDEMPASTHELNDIWQFSVARIKHQLWKRREMGISEQRIMACGTTTSNCRD